MDKNKFPNILYHLSDAGVSAFGGYMSTVPGFESVGRSITGLASLIGGASEAKRVFLKLRSQNEPYLSSLFFAASLGTARFARNAATHLAVESGNYKLLSAATFAEVPCLVDRLYDSQKHSE